MPGLNFTSSIDDGFEKDLRRMNSKMNEFSNNVISENSKMDNSFRNLGTAVGAYFSVQALSGFTTQLITVRGEFEKLGIAFETMLGSKEKADKLMADITEMASRTPFSLQEVAGGAKQLLAFGESNETVIDTLRRLGDVAAGTGTDIAGLNLAYGQVLTKGKLQSQEMYQFAERGVPLIQELAKVMGVTKSEVAKLVEEGKVGFPLVQKAINNLTSEGGIFFNLMEKQSASISGMVSNLGDAYDKMLNEIGKGNEQFLKGSVTALITLVENWENILNVIKVLVATYGTYKAALITTIAFERARAAAVAANAVAVEGLTAIEVIHIAVVDKLRKAYQLMMAMNPYAVALGAVALLISAIVLYRDEVKEATETQLAMARVSNKVSDEFGKQKESLKQLLETARNQTLTDTQRYNAIKKIKDIMPEYNAEISKEGKLINENTKAVEAYLKQLELQIKLKAIEDELTSLIENKIKQTKQLAIEQANYNTLLKETPAPVVGGGVAGTGANAARAAQEQSRILALNRMNKANATLSETNDAIKELQKSYQGAESSLFSFTQAANESGVTQLRTIKTLETELADLEKKRKEATSISDTAELNRLAALIVKKRKEIDAFKIESVKVDKNQAIKDLDAINQQRINAITQEYGNELKLKRIFDIKMLENELQYVAEKSKITTNALEQAKLEEERIKANTQLQNLKNDETLQILLEQYKSYTKQRMEIDEEYNKQITLLNKQGFAAEASLAEQAKQERINKLDESLLSMSASYQSWLKNDLPHIVKRGVDAVQEQLDLLQAKQSVGGMSLSDEDKVKLEGQIKELKAELDKLKGKVDNTNDSFKNTLDLLDGINQLTSTLVETFGNGSEQAKIMTEGIAGGVAGLLNMADALSKVSEEATALENATVIIAAITYALKAIKSIADIGNQLEQARIDKQVASLELTGKQNEALLEQNLLYKEGSEFFADDKWGKALNSLNAYNEALKQQNTTYQSINDSFTDWNQTGIKFGSGFGGTKNKKEVREIIANAKTLGTIQEQALGSILIEEKVKRDVIGVKKQYKSLLDAYPGIIDANGQLNQTILGTVIASGKLSATQATALINLQTNLQQSEQAFSAFGDYVSSVFGNVGDTITQAFQNMYEGGADAISALEDSFSDMIETFTRDAIEFAFLQPYINQLNDATKTVGMAYAKGDISADKLQADVIGELGKFYTSISALQPKIIEAFKTADELAASKGFGQAFATETNAEKAARLQAEADKAAADKLSLAQNKGAAAVGQIQQAITEETGGQLVGRLGAIMLSNEKISNLSQDMYDISVQNLIVTNQIKQNTDYLPTIAENTRRTVEKLTNL